MWAIDVVCSDPTCAAEREAIVEELDEVDRVVCECGCCVVTLAVVMFEPVHRVVA